MKNLLLVFAMIFLTACASSKNKVKIGDNPFIEGTPTEHLLKAIPPLKEQPIITVSYTHLTLPTT